MSNLFDPTNPTAFELLSQKEEQQPFTINKDSYQQANTSTNTNTSANGMTRNQKIGYMLAAISDAFAGRDVAGRAMARAQAIKQQAEVDRQRQKALEKEKIIKTLGAGMTPDMKILAQYYPDVYAQYLFRENAGTSPSDEIKLLQLDVLKTLKNYEGSFEERVETLKKQEPAKYGIYKDYIEQREIYNLLKEIFEGNLKGKPNNKVISLGDID